jgi:ribosomal-protein-serine acetyltransferase
MCIIWINDKIRLESLKLSMAETIFNTINRDREYLREWLPFIDKTEKITDTENFISAMVNQKEIKKDEVFSIWFNEEFAGLIGFKDTDWVNRKTEIGYWLGKKMQGKGIMTSCVKKLVSYSFDKLKLNRVQIKVAVGNTKSSAIPIRLGFKYEGTERDGEFHSDKFLNLEVYSLLLSDL